MSALCHNRTHAVQPTSGRAFPAVSFVYLSVECPFNKFYGINCRPKLDAKLLDRFFHRRRQVSPPVNNLTHRFFDGLQHFLYCNFTVGSRHSAVVSFLPEDKPLTSRRSVGRRIQARSTRLLGSRKEGPGST